MELRLKYADQPDRFLRSEVDLDEMVASLLQVGGLLGVRVLFRDFYCDRNWNFSFLRNLYSGAGVHLLVV